MKELIFATYNFHKVDEIKKMLTGEYRVFSLSEIGLRENILEIGETLQENALIKVRHIFNKTKKACFADDTGLKVDALNDAPGVFSARYAGKEATFEDNINKLLMALDGESNRRAEFRTIIAYIDSNGKELFFEGKVEGSILIQKKGEKGFGYDPIFLPDGFKLSFAEMSLKEKSKISHRAKAVQRFAKYLKSY